MKFRALILFSVAVAVQGGLAGATEPSKTKLPPGFVYLTDIAPAILEDVRYATPWNFTGAPVPGYEKGKCILAQPVAKALAKVQTALAKDGYALKVYDCYRPQRAVNAFVAWARTKASADATRAYHPRLTKTQVIAQGYIATRSSHPRGISVDLTLVPLTPATEAAKLSQDKTYGACNGPHDERLPDTGLDMGTGWDCFDKASHTDSAEVSKLARANRNRLRRAMQAQGFKNFAKEWWHYSLPVQGFSKSHDFAVR